MNRHTQHRWLVAACFLLIGCQPEKTETPTRGHLNILLPESAAPVLIRQVNAFMALYRKNGADVSYSIVSSDEAIRKFISDTLRAIFTTRALTDAERESVHAQSEDLMEIALAYDALVAVVHYKNPVEQITTKELEEIIQGRVTRWEQLSHSKSMKGDIHLAMQDSSDVSFYVKQRLGVGERKNIKVRVPSSLQTLRHVVSDERALGLVGLNWIDSARVPVKMLEIAQMNPSTDSVFAAPPESIGKFYAPHPAHIYRSYYPLKRTLYYYTRSRLGDIAAGFGSFVANKEGQKIFLQQGLVPNTQPIRLKPSEE